MAMSGFPAPNEIADLVHNYFASRGEEVTYDPELGLGTYGKAEFAVHNMAANLARIDREEWPDYVAWHFRHLHDGPPELPDTYNKAKRRLRVRLASDAWVDALPYQDIARPVAEDLQEVLMLTIDGGAASIPPDSVEAWGQPLERLWTDARENNRLEEPRERCALLRPTGEQLTWVRGSWWAASLLLDLGLYMSAGNQHGALAMAPVRDALLYREIDDTAAITSVSGLLEVGLRFHADGPDQVSPHVYWWRDGEVRRVIQFDGVKLNPVWGDDFRRMLAELEATMDLGLLN